MESIAKGDLNSPDVLEKLGIAAIEKFNPDNPDLPENVRARLDELAEEGKTIKAFYDKTTNKIFVNENIEDDVEIRASIVREWKISEDLKDEKGKPNEEGRLKATVAGELAYDDMMKRGREGKTESISTDRFADAVMDEDSEVTADNLWDKGKALFAKTWEDGKQLAAGLKKDAKKLKAEAEYQFRKVGNNVIALKEQYIDKNPKKANETRQKIKADRSETTRKKKQYDAEAKKFKDKSDKRKQQIDRDLKTKEENDRQQKIRKEKQLKEERDEIDKRSRKQHEDTRVITEQEKEYIEYVLKNKDKSSIFEGYDVQIIGKSGDNYIIKETSKPIFRTDLPQQYQYMNFKYPSLNEIRKEVYEGRAISSPGFFVVGYGVTPERADANRDSKNKALVNGIGKTGIGGYRVIKGGGLVLGGAATCPETLIGCGVAAVGAANVGFGFSDGIEGFQELGYAFSGKGNTLTTGNAITEFEQIKKGKNPQVKNGIKAFNPLKYVMGEENYDYWNMTSAMALPHAISYNSIFNSPSSTESSTQNKVTKTLINENKMLIEDNNGKAVIQKTPSGYISGYGRYNNKFIFGEKKVAPAISLESSNVENSVSLTVVKNEVTVFNPAVNNTPAITGGNALNLPPLYISGTTRTEGTKLNIEKITQPSRNLVEPKVVETQKDSKPVTEIYFENYGTEKTSNKMPPFSNRENIHINSNTQNYDYKVQDNSGSNGSSNGDSGSKKNIEPSVENSGKTYTLESQYANWNFKSEIPKTAVKNSEGNYTPGRNNEWSVNNTVTSVKKMETSGLNDVYKVEINNGITPNYAIVNGQNFLTMKEYNNIATKMYDSIKPLNAIKDPVLNVETVREYLADNSYIKSKFLKENKLTVAIGKITLSDGTTENVIAVNGWDGKVWKNGKIPNTISIETTDNQIFKVIKDDNPSLKKFDNWNHAEKKIASYAQDNYSGKISKIEISVQNNSLIFPGMCEGCNKSMFDFYQKNPKTDITIYEGTTGKEK